jgi:hypothetical protein
MLGGASPYLALGVVRTFCGDCSDNRLLRLKFFAGLNQTEEQAFRYYLPGPFSGLRAFFYPDVRICSLRSPPQHLYNRKCALTTRIYSVAKSLSRTRFAPFLHMFVLQNATHCNFSLEKIFPAQASPHWPVRGGLLMAFLTTIATLTLFQG